MIEVLIIIVALLLLGHYKKDFTTLFFSGFGFVFYGLMTLNLQLLDYPYNYQFGVLCICYGLYVCLRSSVDLISNKRKEVKNG